MQQPGLQQVPGGWPGMPGLQAPLSAQTSPFATSQSPQFSSGQSLFPAPGQGSFPTAPPPSGMPAYQPPFPHQLQGQYPVQGQPAPQPQAAPVAPVAFPGSPYGSAQPQGQQAPPNPAQAIIQQLVEMAKALEQLVPGYQTVLSLLLELGDTASSGVGDISQTVAECLYYHGASLGAIRRLLCGEATPAVLTNLATAYHGLNQVQPRLGPAIDRVLNQLPAAQRGPAASLIQTLSTAEGQLSQVGSSIQGFVGPQVWEGARSQARQRSVAKLSS